MEVKPGYLCPKGYKQTEVGDIPEEWGIVELAETARVVDSLHQTPSFAEDGYPMVRVTDIKPGNLSFAGTLMVTDEVFAEFTKNYKPKRGDIVLSRVGSYGVSSFVETDEPFCMGQNTVVLQPKLPPRFLYYVLNSRSIRQQIEDGSYGSGYKSLSLKNIKELRIPVPPTDAEQRAIAEALSDVDGLLDGLDRLIAKKRDLKQAAMQQLLTGQTRLPGFHGEWGMKQLGELIVRLKKTTRPSSSGRAEGAYPFFTNTTKPVDRFLDEADFDTEAIIANTGGEAYFNYYNGSFAAMADCFVFETRLVTRFLYYFLKSVERAVNDNGFTGSGIKHLDKKYFYQMEVRCPAELPEQTAIAAALSDMDAELAALEQRWEKTRALKQAMMQELLTGRIRLI